MFPIFALVALAGCVTVNFKGSPPPEKHVVRERMALLEEMKTFQRTLGWKPTENFLTYRESFDAYYNCGKADALSFEVHWVQAQQPFVCEGTSDTDAASSVVEAVAWSGTPISRSMVESTLERFIYLVFHEDFHEQIPNVPSYAVNESFTQLIGALAARDFIEQRFGAHSFLYKKSVEDIEKWLGQAVVEKRYYDDLLRLYASARKGRISRPDALAAKALLYKAMREECAKHSFSCEYTKNNVDFANLINYALHYPLAHELHRACGKETRKVSEVVVALTEKKYSEAEFLRAVERAVRDGCR